MPGDITGRSEPTVSVTDIEYWLDEMATLFCSHAAQFACEERAAALGLVDATDALHHWRDGLIRGMWYQLAQALICSPLPWEATGARLLEIDATVPEQYRMLHIDLQAGHEYGFTADNAARYRASLAFTTASQIVGHTAEQALVDWQFSKQLLGLGPDEPYPEDPRALGAA